MNRSMRLPRRRAWAHGILALACASVMALSGLPSLDSAEAAPAPLKPGKRCDELFGLKGTPTKSLPQGDASRVKDLWDQYEYVNPGMEFDGLNPTQAELDAAGKDYKKYGHDDPRRIYARFNAQKRWKDFDSYLIKQYIPNQGNDPRGDAFEKKVVKEMGLTGPDWICQKEVYFTDPDTGERHKRVLDAYNKKTREIVEMKSNGKPDGSQKPADKAWAKHRGWSSYKYTFVFGEKQESDARTFMKEMKESAGKDALGRERVRAYNFHSDHKPQAPRGTENGPYRRNDPFLSNGAGKNTGSRGGGNDLIRQSPATPKDLKEQLDRIKANDPQGRMPKGPGGIDFSTLDLRYVGKPVKGEGLNYAFSAKHVDDEYAAGWGGREKAQLISDSFFTWLALDPSTFWVNLNPDEPNRIMDAKFGKTDAGRVLLEADFRLKHDLYGAMDPKTDRGKRFWDTLPRRNGAPCLHALRAWIEPETAVVREQDGGIHILDTPLKLNTVPQDFDADPGKGCDLTEAEKNHADRMLDTWITPYVTEQINNAPQYADLRRVFTARVAAEWIRQQDAKTPTDYREIINSGDVSKWPLRAPNQDWTREGIFNQYVKIFKEGEFTYEWSNGTQTYVYTVGGVDYSKAPKRNLDPVRFRTEHRYKPRTAEFAVGQMTEDADKDGFVMLGGNTSGKSTGGDVPTPTPTPTDEPTDKPTDSPSTPTPSTPPSGGNDGKPTPPAKDPDGDLADTGSDTPVGLIAGIAAALAAAGAALMWWKRRRKVTAG
ncbi:LPXTG cell wall anchor domain-containing protein [Streptomyces vilmorinianum]|uniref:LPXTG cell wall anchor domain-containing protein n=1 Tax=Streptomyces vilmorinianum TaxID=3051092 RepID=UPI0020C7B13C|nr:LPXTG cell wall anchor domain-containing protein [Streptomyces vilmorinianum]